MTTWNNNLDGGSGASSGTTITVGNSGGSGNNAFSSINGSPVFDTAHVHDHTLAALISEASGGTATMWIGYSGLGSVTGNVYSRFYLYITAYPTQQTAICSFRSTAAGVSGVRMLTTGKLQTVNGSNSAIGSNSANSLPLNTLIRVEVRTLPSTTAGEVEIYAWWMNPDDPNQADADLHVLTTGAALGAASIDINRWGIVTAPTAFTAAWQAWIDDVGVSDAGWLGPLGGAGLVDIGASISDSVAAHHPSSFAIDERLAEVVSVDAMTQTSSGGMGVDDLGTPWDDNGPGSTTKGSGSALVTMPTATGSILNQRSLVEINSLDGEASISFQLPTAPTGSSTNIDLLLRFANISGAGYGYRCRVNWGLGGGLSISVDNLNGGTAVNIATVSLGSGTPGLTYTIRFRAASNKFSAKVWLASSSEPDWQILLATDSSPYLQAGQPGFRIATGATTAGMVYTFSGWKYRAGVADQSDLTSESASRNPGPSDVGYAGTSIVRHLPTSGCVTGLGARGVSPSGSNALFDMTRFSAMGATDWPAGYQPKLTHTMYGFRATRTSSGLIYSPKPLGQDEALLIAAGVTPIINLGGTLGTNPTNPDFPYDPVTFGDPALVAIAAGTYDSVIDGWIDALHSSGGDVFIRLWREPVPGHPWYTATPAHYVAAWRYVRNRIRAQIPTAAFMFAVGTESWWNSDGSAGASQLAAVACYPGDDVVDLIGADGYERLSPTWADSADFQTHFKDGPSNSHTGTQSWYEWGTSHSKPLIITETGAQVDPANVLDVAWVTSILPGLKNMPEVIALVPWAGPNYPITTADGANTNVQTAYQALFADPYMRQGPSSDAIVSADVIGGGAGGSVTVDCYVFFPAALLAASTSVTTDVVWVSGFGDGSDPSIEPFHQIQAIFLEKVGGIWQWYVEWGTLSPAGAAVGDTWYHIELVVASHLDGTIDYELKVDGVSLLMEVGSPSANATVDINHVGIGSDATGDHTGPIYLDQVAINGVPIDSFEGGSLSAWAFTEGAISISTDEAHDGTHSLKADDTAPAPAYVVLAVTPVSTTPPPPPPLSIPVRAPYGLACGDYQLFIYPRGLGDRPLGLLDLNPGWTSLTWEWRWNDKSQAQVSFANISGASDSCRGLFAKIRNWQHELVVVRSVDGRIWSGPIVQRGVQSGTGQITAYLLDYWLSRRDLLQRHNLPAADVVDAYAEIWHDAIDRDNSMGYSLVTGDPLGIVVPVDIKRTDHQMADQAIQPLIQAGLDYVTFDRTTTAGPSDTTLISPQLLDSHCSVTPDVNADGTVQSNRYGVTGSTTGNNAAATPYAEADRDDLTRRDGELVTIGQSQESSQPLLQATADTGIGQYGDVLPSIGTIQLHRDAPFKLTDLIPGRLMDVRLFAPAIPVSGIYRLTRVYATVTQNSGETINLELTPVQAVDVQTSLAISSSGICSPRSVPLAADGSFSHDNFTGSVTIDEPCLIMFDGAYHVAEIENSSDGHRKGPYVYHFTGGAFSEVGLSLQVGADTFVQEPRIAADGTDLYAAWCESTSTLEADRFDDFTVHVKKWNGSTWVSVGTPQQFANPIIGCVQLVVVDGVPYIGWVEYDPVTTFQAYVYFRRWNGTSWVDAGGTNPISNATGDVFIGQSAPEGTDLTLCAVDADGDGILDSIVAHWAMPNSAAIGQRTYTIATDSWSAVSTYTFASLGLSAPGSVGGIASTWDPAQNRLYVVSGDDHQNLFVFSSQPQTSHVIAPWPSLDHCNVTTHAFDGVGPSISAGDGSLYVAFEGDDYASDGPLHVRTFDFDCSLSWIDANLGHPVMNDTANTHEFGIAVLRSGTEVAVVHGEQVSTSTPFIWYLKSAAVTAALPG